MVMSRAGFGIKNDRTGEGQQQFTRQTQEISRIFRVEDMVRFSNLMMRQQVPPKRFETFYTRQHSVIFQKTAILQLGYVIK
jgi:hypothetical protein